MTEWQIKTDEQEVSIQIEQWNRTILNILYNNNHKKSTSLSEIVCIGVCFYFSFSLSRFLPSSTVIIRRDLLIYSTRSKYALLDQLIKGN